MWACSTISSLMTKSELLLAHSWVDFIMRAFGLDYRLIWRPVDVRHWIHDLTNICQIQGFEQMYGIYNWIELQVWVT